MSRRTWSQYFSSSGGPTHPAAGPAEPSNPDPIELPNLRLASFNDAREPLLPEVVVSKFDTDEVLRPKWSKCTADFRQLVQNEILTENKAAIQQQPKQAATLLRLVSLALTSPWTHAPCLLPASSCQTFRPRSFQEDQMFLSLLFTLVL